MNLTLPKINMGLRNDKGELSGRRLTAAAFVIMSGYTHYEYLSKENAFEFLMLDGLMTLICLGLVTIQDIIKLKYNKE